MDETRALTNKIFKQKINEYLGADVVELPTADDDRLLDCKVFEAGMNALKDNKNANTITCYASAALDGSTIRLNGVWYTPDPDIGTTPQVPFEDLYNGLSNGKEVIIYCNANLPGAAIGLESMDIYSIKFILKPSIFFIDSSATQLERAEGQISFTSAYAIDTPQGIKEWLLELQCNHTWEEAGDYYRTIWKLAFESLF